MAAITGTILGAAAAASASGGMGLGAGAAVGGAIGSMATSIGYMAGMDPYGIKPDIPDPPEPEARVDKGDEGIRRGAVTRESTKRLQSQLLRTRGSRADDATLGGYMQTLGG